MSELAFLDSVAGYLAPRLAPAKVGFAEPAAAADLPALVLSLAAVERPAAGLGERSEKVRGALAARSTIDLAAPRVDGEEAPFLLSPDRRGLALLHGGLVRNDGSDGPFAAADLRVTVAGAARTLIAGGAGAPGATEFRVDPEAGLLTFGAPLPDVGAVVADYFIGQWERGLLRISGTLRIDACAAAAAESAALSAAAVAALLAPEAGPAVRRLVGIGLQELGSVAAPEAEPLGSGRRRTARFRFEFEGIVDTPESAGGPIRRVRLEPGLFIDDAGATEADDVVVIERTST